MVAYLLNELETQGGLVVFDGLGEVPADQRRLIKEAVTNFAVLYGKCRVVATCRTHSYRADAGWQLDWPAVHELAPLSQEKIQQFIEAWYNTLSTIEAVRVADYSRKAAKLKDALAPEDPRQLDKLAGNLLLLTVMAIVHTHKNELSDSRVEVYAECVDILLHRWRPARTQGAAVKSLHDELSECGVRQATLFIVHFAKWPLRLTALVSVESSAASRHVPL